MKYEAPDGEILRITFNGEVYNFLELRDELRLDGYQFATETDTEVVAAAWHRWGPDAQKRFNGMWALGIWREKTRSLVLSRDRFGVKPLYVFASGERFAFASEIKAFLALSWYSPQLDRDAAGIFFQNSSAYDGLSPATALSGVTRVPPGHSITVSQHGTTGFVRWWDIDAHASDVPLVPDTWSEQVAVFRALFLDAVRVRMRSDVPIGTSLSGGLDSSAVACSMAHVARMGSSDLLERCAREWQRTFIATFPGHEVDERTFADLVVSHTGAIPEYWPFRAGAALRDLPASVYAMDDLSAAPAVPVLNIYRLMRRYGVVVTLDGHGGDELLAGYPWYRSIASEQLNASLRRDFEVTHLPSILRNFDGCSMASGVEVRSPFMDWRLVKFASALPPEAKLDATYTKRILREALTGILPDQIRMRTSKLGFESPLVAWANGGLGPVLLAATRSEAWRTAPQAADAKRLALIVEARATSRAWTMEDRVPLALAYRLLSFVLWNEQFGCVAGLVTRMLSGRAATRDASLVA